MLLFKILLKYLNRIIKMIIMKLFLKQCFYELFNKFNIIVFTIGLSLLIASNFISLHSKHIDVQNPRFVNTIKVEYKNNKEYYSLVGKILPYTESDNKLFAIFNVSDQIFSNIMYNNVEIDLHLNYYPSIKTIGYIEKISSSLDLVSLTYRLVVALPDPPEEFKFSQFINGSITITKNNEIIELPSISLNSYNSKPVVWVVNPQNNSVSFKEVTILSYTSDKAIISNGLKNGDIVVTDGAHLLYPGQLIKILNK